MTAPVDAQTAEELFAATLEAAVRRVGEVKGRPEQVRARANLALDKLEDAGRLLPRLDPKRRAFARFFLSVWRAEVHLRVGQTASLQAAVTELKLARRKAYDADAYKTYYRVQCLIVLWQCAAAGQFEELVREFGDRDYLLGEASEADLTKDRAGAAELIWPLRLLRCDLRLATHEQSVVEEWRVLAEQIKETRDPDLRPWRHVCLGRLIWYYLERRDYDRARLFVDELPADKARYPRVLIASKRRDYETVVREGLILAKDQKIYLQLVADAREAMGDVTQALRDLDQVLAIPGLGAVDRAAALNTRGDCHLRLAGQDPATRTEHLTLAGTAYDRALAALVGKKSKKAGAERAETLKDLGRLKELAGESMEACRFFLQSIEEVQRVRSGIALDLLGISFLESDQLTAVDGALRTAQDPLLALVAMDTLKARDLLDWLEQPPTAKDLGDYRQKLRDLAMAGNSQARLDLEELRSAGRRRDGKPIQNVDELRLLLSELPDTLVLSYWVGEQGRVYLVAATGGDEIAADLHDLGERGKALRLLAAAFEAVSSPAVDPDEALAAAARYFLPDTVRTQLQSRRRVVFCPDANLHRLPFVVLPHGGRPLGVSKLIYATPSLAILARLLRRQQRGSAGKALIVDSATPPPDQQRTFQLSPLQFSKVEGDLVAASYASAVRLRQSDATFARLRQVLASPVEVLHISAHAVEHPHVPSSSLLMLSDGPADMGSMASLGLDGSLVVLSNCQSLGARGRAGEGVNGLIWGPLAGGARGVVASQWPVNQQATADLMAQLHHFRSQGHSDAEALRRARMRLAGSRNYKHPYYWAGFALVAAPPPAVSSRWSPWWLAVPTALILLFLLWRRRA